MRQRYIYERVELHAAPQAQRSVCIPGKITRNLSFNRYKCNTADKRGGGEAPAVLEEIAELVSNTDSVEQEIDRRELIKAIDAFWNSFLRIREAFLSAGTGTLTVLPILHPGLE